MTPSEKKFCYDNILRTSQLYGDDNVRCTATNKVDKDTNVPCKMTPQETVTQLRKIATYSTSKKEVCTQAADLIEEYQEEYNAIIEKLNKATESRDNWKYEAECHHDIAVEVLKDNDKTRETH